MMQEAIGLSDMPRYGRLIVFSDLLIRADVLQTLIYHYTLVTTFYVKLTDIYMV